MAHYSSISLLLFCRPSDERHEKLIAAIVVLRLSFNDVSEGKRAEWLNKLFESMEIALGSDKQRDEVIDSGSVRQ